MSQFLQLNMQAVLLHSVHVYSDWHVNSGQKTMTYYTGKYCSARDLDSGTRISFSYSLLPESQGHSLLNPFKR